MSCWMNKFHPTLPPCTKPGTWQYPPIGADNCLLRQSRWCTAHKHDTDVRVQDGLFLPPVQPTGDVR